MGVYAKRRFSKTTKDFIHKLLPADVKAHNHKASILGGLIARDDKRLSIVIYKAWQKGAIFDQWMDKFSYNVE